VANTAGRDNADSTPVRKEAVQYQAVPASAPPLTAAEDRQWAFMAHCGGILGCVPSLVVYLVFRTRGPFAEQEAKEALNFTLPPTLLAVVANILALVLSVFAPVAGSVFAVLAVAIWIFLTVFSVVAAVHVNRGQPYRYPLNLRLIH
jgi:uncharacterized protein